MMMRYLKQRGVHYQRRRRRQTLCWQITQTLQCLLFRAHGIHHNYIRATIIMSPLLESHANRQTIIRVQHLRCFQCLCLSMSVCLPVSLSNNPSLYLSFPLVSFFVALSTISLPLSVQLCLRLSVCLPACLRLPVSLCLVANSAMMRCPCVRLLPWHAI